MRHITAKTTSDRHGVEVDITRDAELMLDQVARAFLLDPDSVEDVLTRLGSALFKRDEMREQGDDTRREWAAAHADAARHELVVGMIAAEVTAPITVRLSPTEAGELADEVSASAARTVAPPKRRRHEHDAVPLAGGLSATVPGQRGAA